MPDDAEDIKNNVSFIKYLSSFYFLLIHFSIVIYIAYSHVIIFLNSRMHLIKTIFKKKIDLYSTASHTLP